MQWDNSFLSILAESILGVVKNASIVVSDSEICYLSLVVNIKVSFFAFLDVLADNFDKIIAVVSTLLMVEAESMEEFVDNSSDSEATAVEGIKLEIQLLHVVLESDL